MPIPQGAAEPVEGLALLRGQLGDERRWVRRSIAGGPSREPQRGRAAHQTFEGTIGVGASHARGMSDRVAGGWTEPQQGRVGQGLGGRKAEWREIELAGHCVVAITTTQAHPRAQGERLDDLDGNPHQSGDETEPEGCVGLPLRGALPWSLEWEVVRRERARRLGHGTQALRAPDPARSEEHTSELQSPIDTSYA